MTQQHMRQTPIVVPIKVLLCFMVHVLYDMNLLGKTCMGGNLTNLPSPLLGDSFSFFPLILAAPNVTGTLIIKLHFWLSGSLDTKFI